MALTKQEINALCELQPISVVLFQAKAQFSLVQSPYQLGRQGDTRDDSAEMLFPSFPQQDVVSRSGMGRDVHSLMLSIQHFLCQPWRRPPSKVP